MTTYAQKDYTSKLGDSDNTIAEAGSLIVAFSNLLGHFGIDINPENLASKLESLEVDPSKLTWGNISQAFPEVGVFSMGNGAPEYSDSIVVFNHNDRISYGAVVDAHAGTIVDSFDGEEKDWDLYGAPKMFVTFVKYPVLEVTPLTLAAPQPEPSTESTTVEPSTPDTASDQQPEDTIVPVKKLSESPDWKSTLKTGLGVIETIAKADAAIHDLDGKLPDAQLHKGDVVYVAARFVKDDIPYYRTIDSTRNDSWYGIPAGLLGKTDKQSEDDLDHMLDEINMDIKDRDALTGREKVIKAGATAEGKVLGFFKKRK